jgi:hypothetical protein
MEKTTKSKKFIALCQKYGVNPDLVPEILSFKAACKVTGDDPSKLPIVKGIAKRHRKRIIADYKISIIAEALRTNKKVDYSDSSRWKYHAVFHVKADKARPSGFGLSYFDYDCWVANSSVGVRHCFPTRDQAIFFGKHFLKLHVDHHLYR